MPTLPWMVVSSHDADSETEAGGEAVVFASRLELRSLRDVPGFLRAASAVRRQVLDSPGALGVSLSVQPVRRTFWTLSAWRDQAALDGFVGAQPHMRVMTRFRSKIRRSTFISWSVPDTALPVSWPEAKERLAGE